uniref:Proteasome subunit beta n=1 Tax=Zea mays TaxID=4577 RepID=B4FA84_MAIZE|nr:unknown [Zea mays]|eukprot:NP_001130703.1 uncharacterized protein LOC100191806 [Zea mays]
MDVSHAGSSVAGEAPTTGEHRMGTTIVGVCYEGGVVLGADSRTSTGMYVANRASDKITQLTDNVYVCRSGSAADTQVISDYVRYFLHQHTIQLGQPATVKVAANLIRLLAYQNKVCSIAFQHVLLKHASLFSLISTWCRNFMLNSCLAMKMNVWY